MYSNDKPEGHDRHLLKSVNCDEAEDCNDDPPPEYAGYAGWQSLEIINCIVRICSLT